MSRKIGDKDIWIRTFEVTEPRKHKKGFTVYKVVSTVFPRSFPEGATKIKVWKRYNDFKKLYKELELVFRQLYLKGEFPKFPKDTMFGRFDEELIEERRKCALALLEFAASYSLLFANKVFVKFFETSYSPPDFEDYSSTKENSSNHQDVINVDETCLIPERVWKQSSPTEEKDGDHHSLSSFTCSSPEPVALNNGADSMLTSSLLSALGETSVQTASPGTSGTSSDQPKVTTFSDSSHSAATLYANPNPFVPSPYTLQESKRNFGMVSSVSCTDDFDLLEDDDGEDSPTSRLSNSVSCLSLDTLPLRKTLKEFKDAGTNNHSTIPEKKKQNGFGFFDFLPIFAKKQETKVEKEKVLAESLTESYICEAAGYFAVANHYESNSEYVSAFEAYKDGIQILLTGAQSDSDLKRRVMVRKKIENYLCKAEALKEKSQKENSSFASEHSSSPILLSPRKKLQGLIDRDSSFGDGFIVIEKNVMPSFIEELKVYKVVGCTFNNILVVVDTTAIGGPKCYAVKVFRKSACTLDPEKPTLIPFTVPFMVQMIKWFNTEDSVILVLQYASGGRLIDFVKAYQTKHISPVIHEVSPNSDSGAPDGCFTFDNQLSASLEISKINVFSMADSVVDQNSTQANLSASTKNQESVGGTEKNTKLESEKKNERGNKNEKEESENKKKDCWSTRVCIPQNVDQEVPHQNSSDGSSNCVKINHGDSSTDPEILNRVVEKCQAICSITNQDDEILTFSNKISSNNFETEKLIEDSKVLIQTVSRTLELGKEQKENSHEGQEVEYLSQAYLSTGCMSESEVTTSSPKIGLKTEVTEKIVATPSNLVSSFSRHLEDIIYNVPTFSSFSTTSDINTSCDEESSPFKRMVPECCTKVWAAEIVIALEKLHNQGITFGDLDINNILLGESGHILLSYRAFWNEVDSLPIWNEFSAPEVSACLGKSLWRVHPSADWWSLGCILFLLITGQTLQDVHPEGMYPQTVISVPQTNSCGELITPSAKTLLAELLQFSPTVRLGYYGAEEIKSHPFFEGFDWDGAVATISNNKS